MIQIKRSKLLALFFTLVLSAFAADVYDEVSNAIRLGDAKQIANYFGTNIDLTLIKQEDVYSKAQAELLVKDFFSKNPPKTFTIIHRGSSREGTLFAVGTLASSNGKTFRVSFNLKMLQGKYILQELRFEPQ
jgi:hypothetical protein